MRFIFSCAIHCVQTYTHHNLFVFLNSTYQDEQHTYTVSNDRTPKVEILKRRFCWKLHLKPCVHLHSSSLPLQGRGGKIQAAYWLPMLPGVRVHHWTGDSTYPGQFGVFLWVLPILSMVWDYRTGYKFFAHPNWHWVPVFLLAFWQFQYADWHFESGFYYG